MTTYALIRRSTNKQEFSVARQTDLIAKFASDKGINIEQYFVEPAVSGKTPLAERPVLLEAISNLRRNDTLVVLNSTRLAREALVFYEIAYAIRKRQAKLVFADGSPSDIFSDNPLEKFMAEMFASIASLERSMIANRVRTGMASARKKGKALGRPDRIRYGFSSVDGKLVPNIGEMSIVAEAMKLRDLGYSYRQVATHLTETHRYNRSGKPFSKQAIRQMDLHRQRDLEL